MLLTKIKQFAIVLAIVFAGGLVAVPAVTSAADFKSDACQGLAQAGGSCSAQSDKDLSGLFHTIIDVMSIIVGIIAVIMIIVGGLKYITSGGDSQAAASARNTVLYALIGVVIAVLAQVLVHFVLQRTAKG